MYYKFLNYLFLNNLSYKTIVTILTSSEFLFYNLDSDIEEEKKKVLSIENNKVKAVVNEYWLKDQFTKLQIESLKEFKKQKIAFTYFLGFIENIEMVSISQRTPRFSFGENRMEIIYKKTQDTPKHTKI